MALRKSTYSFIHSVDTSFKTSYHHDNTTLFNSYPLLFSLFFSCSQLSAYFGDDDDDDDDADDVVLTNPPTSAAAAVRRTTTSHCPTSPSSSSSSGGRSKPPPPVRRTSSVTGSRPLIQSPTTADCYDRRWGELSSPAAAVPPGGFPSPSRPRSIVDGRPTSPRRTPPLVRVSPAPRRSLSSAYADLCQTLNDQLAAGGAGAMRRPGGQRLSAVDSSTSTAAPAPRRQSSAEVGAMRSSDTLLMDIKRGVCLKPTVSNDRSAPSIPRT